jgi:hypothetical protein
MMNRKLPSGLALSAGLLLWASAANADMIGIGGAAGSITFTSNGNGTISFSTAGFTSTGLTTFQSPTGVLQDTGNSTFGAMSGSTGVEVGNIFPITSGGTETFSYTSTTDSDMMSGTITWPAIKDGTTSPQFDVNAVLTVTSSSGDATFTGDFPVGSMAGVDFTVSVATTLTTLAGQAAGSTVSGAFSSGEVVPHVPEPASLSLLAVALLAFGGYRPLRRRASAA